MAKHGEHLVLGKLWMLKPYKSEKLIYVLKRRVSYFF